MVILIHIFCYTTQSGPAWQFCHREAGFDQVWCFSFQKELDNTPVQLFFLIRSAEAR